MKIEIRKGDAQIVIEVDPSEIEKPSVIEALKNVLELFRKFCCASQQTEQVWTYT